MGHWAKRHHQLRFCVSPPRNREHINLGVQSNGHPTLHGSHASTNSAMQDLFQQQALDLEASSPMISSSQILKNFQINVCSQTQWQLCVPLSPRRAGGAEEEWQHSVGKLGKNAPRLPQGFASGLPALHDLTASELLGASSTPPRILPAQLPNSALPASPGNPGNGHHRNISAHWRESLEAQIWRDRQRSCTPEHKYPSSTR